MRPVLYDALMWATDHWMAIALMIGWVLFALPHRGDGSHRR